MEEFLHWFQGKMVTPTWFGWFHILYLCLMVAECVTIYIFRKKMSKKTINLIILCTGIALIIFEIYKQIVMSFRYNGGNGNSTWIYQWYSFPFQFCSTPMYLMVLAGILRKGKAYDCIMSYLSTFALFGGLVVMVYPGDVFTTTIGINIQTMFWHSSMFSIGFLILATRSVEFNLKTILKASIVFCIMLALALMMNIAWHYGGIDKTFNMFYISPYYKCPLALLNIIYDKVPYIIFLAIYIIGFMLAATLMMATAILLDKLEKSLHTRKMFPDEIAAQKAIEIIRREL